MLQVKSFDLKRFDYDGNFKAKYESLPRIS